MARGKRPLCNWSMAFGFSWELLLASGLRASAGVPYDLQSVSPAQVLPARMQIEKTIKSGEVHPFRVPAGSRQFLRFLIKQQGVEISLKLAMPSGKVLVERAGSIGPFEPQRLLVVTEQEGLYTLELRAMPHQPGGRYELTLAEQREARPGDPSLIEADTFDGKGNEFFAKNTQDSLGQAIDRYQKALPLWQAAGDREWEARTLLQMGRAFTLRNDAEPALRHLEQALSVSSSLRDRLSEAAIEMTLSDLYLGMSNANKGLERGLRSLELSESAGAVWLQASAASNIGIAYLMLGDPQQQVKYGERAVALDRAIGNDRDLATALNNLAASYESRGDYNKALPAYREALSFERAFRDRRGEASTLTNIGELYWRFERYREALANHTKALAIRREIGDRRGLSFSMNHIGMTMYSLGRPEKALQYFNEALRLKREVKEQAGEASTLGNIAVVYFKALHDFDRALVCLNEALSLWTAVQNLEGQSAALGQLGRLHLLRGDTTQAENHFKRALAISRTIKYRPDEARVLHQLATIARDRGDIDDARTGIEGALAIAETSRSGLVGEGLRASFFATTQGLYEFYIDLLMRLHHAQPGAGYDRKALEAAERARARGLLDALIESRADIRTSLDPVLVDREKALGQRIDTLAHRQTQLLARQHTDGQAAATEKDLSALLLEYEEVKTQIRAASPKYASLTQPQPLSATDIQAQVVDDNTVLLEYALGDEQSYLWGVTPTSVTSVTLPKRNDIEALARRAHDALAARNRKVSAEALAARQARVDAADRRLTRTERALSHLLIDPVASIIRGKRLVIVANGALQFIPFGVLPVPGRTAPLVAEHEIVSLPSASTLAILRQDQADRTTPAHMLAVLADPVFDPMDPRVKALSARTRPTSTRSGDAGSEPDWVRAARDAGIDGTTLPRLAHAREEADSILALVPAAQRLGALDFQASRGTATDERLAQYRIVHFAAHGFVNSVHPELSGVALSMVDERGRPVDGYLRLHLIYSLSLPADLVVLSACQTAFGRDVKGEGLVSLTRGFMYAGASRVVASLWSVDDQATAELMKEFYRAMLGSQHLSPAAALRHAQVTIRRQERWRAPYYWAGFVLQGEYR